MKLKLFFVLPALFLVSSGQTTHDSVVPKEMVRVEIDRNEILSEGKQLELKSKTNQTDKVLTDIIINLDTIAEKLR